MICYKDPNNYNEKSDSACIQAAIDDAEKSGINKVVVPRYNKRRGDHVWIISETILIPSNMTVVLDNCALRMADGVFCNMFRNSHQFTSVSLKPEGEQNNIKLLGFGNATLDGGRHNGLTEKTSLKDGLPHISNNTMIYFHNVRDFVVENIRIINQRWWAMTFMFARHGRISNIDFMALGDVPNQDGIDLRVGCNNIIIENITGYTGDDTIALTALLGKNFEGKVLVEGRDNDIFNIIIKNVMAATYWCSIVRLLNHYGNKIYNIDIDTIVDRSVPYTEKPSKMAIRIGDDRYYNNDVNNRALPGDTYNISVKNITTRADVAVQLDVCVKDCYCNNIKVTDDGGCAFGSRNAELSNILVDGVFFCPDEKNERREPVCNFENVLGRNIIFRNVFAGKAKSLIKTSGGAEITFENVVNDDKSDNEIDKPDGDNSKVIFR